MTPATPTTISAASSPVDCASSTHRALPPADGLPVQREATLAFRAARLLLAPVLRALFRFDVEGRANIPADGSNFVLIANHLNWIDAIAIVRAFPNEPRVHFMGDPTDLVGTPTWRFIRMVGGFVAVDRSHRSGPQLFDHVQLCLERGGVVALFPEGRYGDTEGAILPFKKGFAHFAVRAGVPVLPVGLSGHRTLWLGKRLTLRIGAPLSSADGNIDRLVAAGEDAVRALIPPMPEPRRGRRLLQRRLSSMW